MLYYKGILNKQKGFTMTLGLTKKEVVALYNTGDSINTILSKFAVTQKLTEDKIWNEFVTGVQNAVSKIKGTKFTITEDEVVVYIPEDLLVDLCEEYKQIIVSVIGLFNSLMAMQMQAQQNILNKWKV